MESPVCESHAKLECPNGMHYDVAASVEWQDEGHWFRAEVWRSTGGTLYASAYVRVGCYWHPGFTPQCAMQKRFLLAKVESETKET